MIGSRAVCRSAKHVYFSMINDEVGNHGFSLQGWSFSPHVDSDKFRNELHSYKL